MVLRLDGVMMQKHRLGNGGLEAFALHANDSQDKEGSCNDDVTFDWLGDSAYKL